MARKRRVMRALGILVAALILALLALAGASALNNRGLPTRSAVTGRLPAAEQARLAEALHLRATLGDGIWPGWGSARNPVVLYNEAFAFIVGEADPTPGWVKVPGDQIVGGPWEVVPDDTFAGATYHRQRLPGSGVTPEAFTVRVGSRYASSLPTMERMQIAMTEQFRRDLPSVLRPIFPYRIATNLFVGGLARSRDDGHLPSVGGGRRRPRVPRLLELLQEVVAGAGPGPTGRRRRAVLALSCGPDSSMLRAQ